jgi:PPOX class probable F420-dependent enzyme
MRKPWTGAALTLLTCLPLCAAAQKAQAPQPDRAKVIQAAREIMQAARYCVLATVGTDGHPQARVMDAFAPENDMTVWMATNRLTRKVGEIRKDPRVTLTYYDTARMSYVTLLGTATLIADPKEKAARWKDDWAELYKERNRGDDYLLIRVKPIRLEISSVAHGLVNDPKTWAPMAIDFR